MSYTFLSTMLMKIKEVRYTAPGAGFQVSGAELGFRDSELEIKFQGLNSGFGVWDRAESRTGEILRCCSG